MDEWVERESVAEHRAEFECSSCGYAAPVTVHGVGYGTSKALWGLWRDRAVHRAQQQSEAAALDNALSVVALTRCPRCGERDRGGVRTAVARTVLVIGGGVFLAALAIAGLGLLGEPLLQIAATFAAVALAVYVVAVVIPSWRDIDERVRFHDPSLPPSYTRVPIAHRPQAHLPSYLMASFGVLGAAFGTWQVVLLRNNPQPVEVACDRAAVLELPRDTWVVVPACVADHGAFALVGAGEYTRAYVPAKNPDSGAIVAWLAMKGSDATELFVEAEKARERGDEEAARRAIEDAAARWPSMPVEGTIGRGSAPVGPEAAMIDPGAPSWKAALFSGGASLVLFVFAIIYWPRRRWTRAAP